MAEVSFTVYGTPAPQGSKRAFVGKSGKAHVIESSHDRVKSWRQAVIDQVRSDGWIVPPFPYSGPLEVEMTFDIKRPKGHYRTGKNAHLLRDSAPAYPSGMPDLSKLARATEDALTEVGLWADDALVVRYARLEKRYADGPRLPGAVIVLREIEAVR